MTPAASKKAAAKQEEAAPREGETAPVGQEPFTTNDVEPLEQEPVEILPPLSTNDVDPVEGEPPPEVVPQAITTNDT